ncbi:MAG: CBS domain-containing protein [Candidatus Omnitrophica bacterium]|nr:CBS domain-containing protein [Candidatus Omnitrophota bacterium]
MKVKEIMKKEVVSLKPEDNAMKAAALLFKMEISGLPVIDAAGNLVGMFTEKEVLGRLLPSYIEKVGKFIYEESPKSIQKKIQELSNMQVQQLMRREVVTTSEDATLCEVARIILTQKARRLPVLDKNSKVTGIIARCDILKAMIEESDPQK